MPLTLTTVPLASGPMPREQWLALRKSIGDERTRLFLGELANTFLFTAARDKIGINRQTTYAWRNIDDTFALGCDEAVGNCTDRIESVMFQQALKGHFRYVMSLVK